MNFNKSRYSNEFLQCISYIYFRDKLKEWMNINEAINVNKNIDFKNKQYYLISKEWIQKWRHYIGFEEINKQMKLRIKRIIEEVDYDWVQPIISQNIKDKYLEPLINRVIYFKYGNENFPRIDPMKNFVIIDHNSFDLFLNKKDPEEKDIKMHPSIRAIFSHKKMILEIDEKNKNYFVSFEYEPNNYYELCFTIESKYIPNIQSILRDFIQYNIKDWINSNNNNINDQIIKIKSQNYYLEIKNKSIINGIKNNKENIDRATLFPNDRKKIKEFQNTLKNDPNITQKVFQIFKYYNETKANKTKTRTNIYKQTSLQTNDDMNNFMMGNNINNNIIKNNINNNMMNNNMNNFNMNNNMMNNNINNFNMNNNMMNNNINNFNMNNNMINNKNLNNNNHNIQINSNNNKNYINNFNENGSLFFPHIIGLQNVGQTCYMNATLECLSNIEELTKHILSYNFMSSNPLTKQLSIFYWDLLSNLFFPSLEIKAKKYYSPYNFKEIIGKMNPLFHGFHAADSKDLLFFILETLHDELNFVNNNMNNINMFNIDPSNKIQVFNSFMNNFILKNNSIITNLFYGFNESCLFCFRCQQRKYTFQSFNITIIPLIKAQQYKLQKYRNNYKILNLYDALESLSQKEVFEGDNMIYCNICRRLTNAYHQQMFFRTPMYFIIVLNRGRGNLDYTGEFEFYEEINLINIVTDQNWKKKYFLMGVISHIGESGSSGHFIAFCRNRPHTPFFCYNDASVYKMKKIDDVLGKFQSNNIYEKKTPYILFYKVMN